MPRVPTYDNLQTTPSAGGTPAFQTPSGPSGEQVAAQQLQGLGEGAQRAGGAVSTIALDMARDANDLRVNDAMNQYVNAQTQARVEAMQLKGRNALERPDGKSLPDEFGERMQKQAEVISQTLANPAQRQAFAMNAGRMDGQFRASLSQHMVEQQNVYRKETQKGTLDTAVNQATLLWGDEKLRAQSVATVTKVVDAIARDNGMPPEARDMALVESLSPLHVGVMKGMIQAGQANAAREYYNENSASMTMQARAAMQGVVKEASDVQTGEAKADAVWATIGPRAANDPVKIFDMEREMRDQLKDNPDAMKRGVDALRQRAQAFNAQQAETNAAGVNSVFKLIDGRVPMGTIMRSDEWMSLPAHKQHEIVKSLEAEAAARESRAYTAEARAFNTERRKDSQLLMGNADAFLAASNPDTLAHMTRAQVEATRTQFGMEGAQHLLTKFDAISKSSDKLVEARMDKQDFDHVAEQMGLDPFNDKSPDKKRQLGELQFRVEQLINTAQVSKKQALTRDEKMTLMQGELARQVTVPGFFSNSQVPVIQLNADDAARVVVPPTDRAQIAQALQTMYANDPKNPAYAPTEANMRRLYLMRQSRAAALIPAAK